MAMAKYEFLKMTPEERAECGRKGGIESGKTKRRKKAMKETLEVLLSMPMKTGKAADVENIKNFADLKGKNISVEEAMLISMIQKALHGNVPAFEAVRDTVGENPTKKIEADITNVVPIIGGEDDLEDTIQEDSLT